MQGQHEKKHASIRIDGSVLIINGTIVPYAKQIIRSHDTMFVTDLGLEIPITEELMAYDEYFFHHMLKKQLLFQIESSHHSVGLEILQQFPNLQAHHYEYLISKLSLKKFTKILNNDDFLLYLYKTFRNIANLPSDYDEEELSIMINLTEPYSRILFLLKTLQQYTGSLKEKLEMTAKSYIYDMINQPNFIYVLAFLPNPLEEYNETKEPKSVNHQFLLKLNELAVYLRYLEKESHSSWESPQGFLQKMPSQKMNETNNQIIQLSSLKYYIFNKNCLNFIGKYFEDFFHFSRKDFLLTLSLIITHNKQQFWSQLIEFNQKNPLETENKSIHQLLALPIDNSNCLREFIINNYFNKNESDWSQTLGILEELNKIKDAEAILINIYQELLQFPLNIDIIQLISTFIKQTVSKNQELSARFKRLLSSFLQSINALVNKFFTTFKKQAKNNQQIKNMFMQMQIPVFPQIKSTIICKLLQVFTMIISFNLLNHLNNFESQKIVQKLITMTKYKTGSIYGARAQLIKTIQDSAANNKNNRLNERRQASLQRLMKYLASES